MEVTVLLSNGQGAKASAPSGASTGIHEALELRDGDPKRYEGKGVLRAINNVKEPIHNALKGLTVTDQQIIDDTMIELDGTVNKSKLGANAILGVSLAVARTAALSQAVPLYKYIRSLMKQQPENYRLPVPLVNVVNGGMHAHSNLDLQEFWIIPHAAVTFAERIRQASEIYHALGALLEQDKRDTDVGDEGGYGSDFESHSQVFDYMLKAIERASLEPVKDIVMGIDAGASVFYDTSGSVYRLPLEQQDEYSSSQMLAFYDQLCKKYPIKAIEDGLSEDDWPGWIEMTKHYKDIDASLQLIGDDLFVTNIKRLQHGIDQQAANAILVKPNQVGSLTETLACIGLAQEHNFRVVISHRSGSTTDTFISDLAVAVNADYIKAGAPTRGGAHRQI